MLNLDTIRSRLRSLSDEELVARIVEDKLASRRSWNDSLILAWLDAEWGECLDRGRRDLWTEALNRVRAEEARR